MDAERERGVVTARHGDRVEVTMGLSAKCEGCKLCDRDGSGELVLHEVLDTLGAALGDTVEVEIPPAAKTSAAFALYVVPVVALLVGYLAGDLLGKSVGVDRDLVGAVGAIGAVTLAFLGLRPAERALFRKHISSPQVRAIIPRGSERR